MENNFNTNDELNQYLIDEVESHKMYPSEHVWENIRTQLHGNPSWPALTFIAIAIILTLTVSTLFNYPPKTIITKTNTLVLKQGNNTDISNAPAEISPVAKTETLEQQINITNYTKETLAAITNKNIIGNEDLIIPEKKVLPSIEIIAQNKSAANISLQHLDPVANTSLLIDNTNLVDEFAYVNQNSNSAAITTTATTAKKSKYQSLSDKSGIQSNENNADSYLNEFGFETKKPVKKPSGFELEFYVTPSVSYRKLEEDNSRLIYAQPTTMALSQNHPTANVNNSVRHTPALGMELGAGILYNLTHNFKLKTGLQFNIRQYYIDATQTYGMATIAFVQNNRLDSVSIASMFGNSTGTNGYYSTKLDNKLYQIAIPIGFQWDFLQGKKWGLSASASIQPTFTLNKNVYMISTDYKYYANGSPFFRKWNFNSSLEFNLTYKTGNVKWYFGPQLRYQHLPTYNDVYPIKEYRLDYGFKIGIATPLFK
ncbi:hypothetical protein GALL_95340 [mine drainage metagenome]|uniref:Outer membrane protein beta-barrel domain-containing protein n=1 Tax=mine drainage metagenome TaxID=410659 RepID=A0A1J5T8A6_9ZZZZ